MKRGVWSFIFLVFFLAGIIYAQNQTTTEPSQNVVKVKISALKIRAITEKLHESLSYKSENENLEKIQQKFIIAVDERKASNAPVVMTLTPDEAKTFINDVMPGIPSKDPLFGNPLITYEQNKDGSWKKIDEKKIKEGDFSYVLPGTAAPALNSNDVVRTSQDSEFGGICFLG